jgi:hypothetical protein
MADNQGTANGHPDMDYAEHEKTFALFVFLVKWTTIGCVVLLVLMAYFLL